MFGSDRRRRRRDSRMAIARILEGDNLSMPKCYVRLADTRCSCDGCYAVVKNHPVDRAAICAACFDDLTGRH